MEYNSLLTQDAHESGAEINIINPVTGEPTDFFITVMGVDSKEWRMSVKKVTRAYFSDGIMTEEKEIDSEVDQLVSITKDWRGINRNGEELKFSKEECRQLYTKSPGVLQQVDRFVADRRNFTKG